MSGVSPSSDGSAMFAPWLTSSSTISARLSEMAEKSGGILFSPTRFGIGPVLPQHSPNIRAIEPARRGERRLAGGYFLAPLRAGLNQQPLEYPGSPARRNAFSPSGACK